MVECARAAAGRGAGARDVPRMCLQQQCWAAACARAASARTARHGGDAFSILFVFGSCLGPGRGAGFLCLTVHSH